MKEHKYGITKTFACMKIDSKDHAGIIIAEKNGTELCICALPREKNDTEAYKALRNKAEFITKACNSYGHLVNMVSKLEAELARYR